MLYKYQQDPLVQARLLVVGRQCLENTLRKVDEAEDVLTKRVTYDRTR